MTLRVLGVSATAQVSGAERVLLSYADPATGLPASWTVASPPGPLADQITGLDIPHVAIPDLKLAGGPKALSVAGLAARNLAVVPTLRQIAATHDVVVANSVMTLPSLRAARLEAKVCWLVHDVIRRPDLLRLARIGAPAVDLAVGVSDAAAELPRQLGIPTVVVRNGVEWPVAPATPAGGPPIVGVNAVLTEWKGQREFLQALPFVDAPFKAELLGGTFPNDGEYEQELRALVPRLGLEDKVTFLGHSDDPARAMRRWSLLVSPSIEPEAGPLAVLEGMSLGLAVVVTGHGGALEIARGLGLQAPPRDSRTLAGCIQQLLTDPQDRARRGNLGRAAVKERFTLARSRTLFAEALNSLCGNPMTGVPNK